MTRSQHDRDRWREALRQELQILDDGAACCAADLLWESAMGQLTPAAERSVVLHIGECTACATSWELARELAPVVESPVQSTPAVWPRAGFAAVAALLLLMFGIWSWRPPAQREPVYRDTSGDWLFSGLIEGQPLSRGGAVLNWSAGPDGTTYDIHVTTDDLTPLARGFDLDRPGFAIDPAALAGLPPDAQILWRVTARLPDGSRVASTTFRTAVE